MRTDDARVGDRPLAATGIRVLIADDDRAVRSLLGALLREAEGVVDVVEAEDGAGAVETARELRVDIAVLDLNMPRLDGVEAAQQLLAEQPSMRIALHSSNPDCLRARAAGLGLPLFDKLDCDLLVAWVERQGGKPATRTTSRSALPRLDLECMRCGYGIVSATPPLTCPMCHTFAAWNPPGGIRHGAPREHAFG